MTERDPYRMSGPELLAHIRRLSRRVVKGDEARNERLAAFDAARSLDPPLRFSEIADAGDMTDSGVINTLATWKAKQQKVASSDT